MTEKRESFFRKWKQHIDKFYVFGFIIYLFIVCSWVRHNIYTLFFCFFLLWNALFIFAAFLRLSIFSASQSKLKVVVSFWFAYCLLVWFFWFHLIVELRSIVLLIDNFLPLLFLLLSFNFRSLEIFFSSNISFKILQNLNNTLHIYTHSVWIIIIFFCSFCCFFLIQ